MHAALGGTFLIYRHVLLKNEYLFCGGGGGCVFVSGNVVDEIYFVKMKVEFDRNEEICDFLDVRWWFWHGKNFVAVFESDISLFIYILR